MDKQPVYGWIYVRFRMDKLHYKSKFYEWPLGGVGCQDMKIKCWYDFGEKWCYVMMKYIGAKYGNKNVKMILGKKWCYVMMKYFWGKIVSGNLPLRPPTTIYIEICDMWSTLKYVVLVQTASCWLDTSWMREHRWAQPDCDEVGPRFCPKSELLVPGAMKGINSNMEDDGIQTVRKCHISKNTVAKEDVALLRCLL